jgi:D-alanyl-lipoteichoic acid acyltransferase DltB (MBOAT superfamily)
LRQILWGLFKKIVIADNCAIYVNHVFANHTELAGSSLWVAVSFFSIQLYGDFSGYSDIAIGTARLFGFKLMRNFNFPLFSRDVAEYWRRWHISQSTWFRDYVYFPLGGSRGPKAKVVLNTFILFLVSGFWHGANWTFVLWGFYNAVLFLPLLILNKNRDHREIVAHDRALPNIKEVFKICFTFFLLLPTRVLFRAESIGHAFDCFRGMFSRSMFSISEIYLGSMVLKITILISILFVIDWIGRRDQYGIEKIGLKWKPIYRYIFYYLLVFIIIFQGAEAQDFVYFQF